MPKLNGESLRQAAGAFGWGLASGLTAGPLIFGSAFAGYRVGRGGRGGGGLLLAAVGLLAGFVVTLAWLVSQMVSSGCPSCVDALIIAPPTFGILLVPLAVGYWFGRRSKGTENVHSPTRRLMSRWSGSAPGRAYGRLIDVGLRGRLVVVAATLALVYLLGLLASSKK